MSPSHPFFHTLIVSFLLLVVLECYVASHFQHLNLVYNFQHLGDDAAVLQKLVEGNHPFSEVRIICFAFLAREYFSVPQFHVLSLSHIQ